MWKKILIPIFGEFTERIACFSLPIDGRLLIIPGDYDDRLLLIDLGTAKIEVLTNERDLVGKYRIGKLGDVIEVRGKQFSMLGMSGGKPILKSPQGEDLQLRLNGKHIGRSYIECSFSVEKVAKEVFRLDFQDFSGDWGQITFSPDGQYIVLGIPYEFYVFERVGER